MKDGKVIIGFSAPYVGVYANAGGTVNYTGGCRLARGVSVSLDVQTSDDNDFYCDNVLAESEAGTFSSGKVKLTVDGLHDAAERMIYGLPEPEPFSYGENETVNVINYGDDAKAPYVGIGYVIEYQSDGIVTYQPMVLPKTKFIAHGTEAKTREKQKDWQTQDLEATVCRDDSAKHNWKKLFEEQTTEEAAIAILKAFLHVGAEG